MSFTTDRCMQTVFAWTLFCALIFEGDHVCRFGIARFNVSKLCLTNTDLE